jgi:hypothetical protein
VLLHAYAFFGTIADRESDCSVGTVIGYGNLSLIGGVINRSIKIKIGLSKIEI